jgi:dehydrogenase/reductase SDR family protein 7B
MTFTVHFISPGIIRTNLSKSALTGDGTAHRQMDKTTANRAEPNEVAIMILGTKGQREILTF